MTLDVDSTVCEVCGRAKHGAAYGHTKVLGYHPLVAVRSDTGEVLHSRMRSGSSQSGHEHFARETLARVRRLAPDASVTVRADSGFFSYDMIAAIGRPTGRPTRSRSHRTPRSKQPTRPSTRTPGRRSRTPAGGQAQVAETTITAGRRGDMLSGDDGEAAKLRLITRRSRLLGAQGELWPNWRYHSFVTDRHDLDTKEADAYHRNHATVELAIRDLKDNGLRRCPRGKFFANGAWLACSVLAHNLARWTARLGRTHPAGQLTVAATIRNRLLTVAGRLVNHSGPTQTAPAAQLAWQNTFTTAWDTSATCPNSSEPPTAPGAAQPNPPATNPHQPHTPLLHAPKRAGPHTRTTTAATRPQTVDPTNPSVDSGLKGFRQTRR